MILVTGGTGTSGKPIVQQLAAARADFRVLARNPDKARQELDLRPEQIIKDRAAAFKR